MSACTNVHHNMESCRPYSGWIGLPEDEWCAHCRALLTVADLAALTIMFDACSGRKVMWLENETTMKGEVRCFSAKPYGEGMLHAYEDVRDGYLHISGMFEHWLPVRDVLRLIKEDKFLVVDEATYYLR